MRLIPKAMASLIPIKLDTPSEEFYDFVYIDDDMLMRISWERKAARQNKKLLPLASTKDFEAHADKINKDLTVIYIDSNLGDGEMKGEDFAAKLHSAGYKNLFIASGYEKDHFAHLPWLGYAGKVCPF
jgi:hypothetical protein